MFNNDIIFKNFDKKKNLKKKKVSEILNNFLNSSNDILSSMRKSYDDQYNKLEIQNYKNINNVTIIGMGGSILGAKAIYEFFKSSSKKFIFVDSFFEKKLKRIKKNITLVISKSGNTLETICNSNLFLQKKNLNIFITEKKKSYLKTVADKIESEIIPHNISIGGRFSVLSEVGMLPAQLMGFKPEKFRILDNLIKNKKFINNLVENISQILALQKKKITNSIILNYDQNSKDLFDWYQQLVGESLGKKNKGIFPVVSTMPKDNHSLMQYYLDGRKNHFFTLFFFMEKNSINLDRKNLLKSHSNIKNKTINEIKYSQFLATEKVLKLKKIPFRSFIIKDRTPEILGELFIFFMLETIILGKCININPFNQPDVELIKKYTNKFLKI